MMNNVTYNVSFPGLGIDLKINPIAFQCPGIKIYWYGIIISIMYIVYLYIIEKTSIYRYVIYLYS